MGKFHDFDAMWGEAFPDEADRPKVRVFGEDVLLPASIPARIILKAVRSAEAGDNSDRSLRLEEVYEQACALYSKERIEDWMDRGLTFKQLDELVGYAIQLYMRSDDEQEDDESEESEGNAKPPKMGAKKNARS